MRCWLLQCTPVCLLAAAIGFGSYTRVASQPCRCNPQRAFEPSPPWSARSRRFTWATAKSLNRQCRSGLDVLCAVRQQDAEAEPRTRHAGLPMPPLALHPSAPCDRPNDAVRPRHACGFRWFMLWWTDDQGSPLTDEWLPASEPRRSVRAPELFGVSVSVHTSKPPY